jgi:hypothetical protein
MHTNSRVEFWGVVLQGVVRHTRVPALYIPYNLSVQRTNCHSSVIAYAAGQRCKAPNAPHMQSLLAEIVPVQQSTSPEVTSVQAAILPFLWSTRAPSPAATPCLRLLPRALGKASAEAA